MRTNKRIAFALPTALVLPLALAMSAGLVGACDSTESGVQPVGGEKVSPTEVDRFVRRAHLDLLGQSATEEFVLEKRASIIAAGNTPSSRAELATELLADPLWAMAFIEELENRLFNGNGFEFGYALQCNAQRQNNPACSDCVANADQCLGCTCQPILDLLEERTGLENTASDLAGGGVSTSEIENRYARSRAFSFGRGIEPLAVSLFEQFVNRPPEADELANASAMIVGFVAAPGNAAGLLFHQHGSNYEDLVSIVFGAEIYREAVVTRAFERLLGRIAKPAELAKFQRDLDSNAPDVKVVITAIVSSGEYFSQ